MTAILPNRSDPIALAASQLRPQIQLEDIESTEPSAASTYNNFAFPVSSSLPNPQPQSVQSPTSPLSSSPHNTFLAPGKHNRARKSLNALPSFSFNASDASGHGDDSATEPLPDAAALQQSPRLGRHRRSASEHVGASGAAALPPFRSHSPQKTAFHVPVLDSTAPPRGHRHRRSGALSSQDISEFVAANAASVLPLVVARESFLPQPSPLEIPPCSSSQLDLSTASLPSAEGPVHVSSNLDKSSGKAASQARVGFSETLEFIPRPLSTVSHDTDSTLDSKGGPPAKVTFPNIAERAANSGLRGLPAMRLAEPASAPSHAPRRTMLNLSSRLPRPKSAGGIMDRGRRNQVPSAGEIASIPRPVSASRLLDSASLGAVSDEAASTFEDMITKQPKRRESRRQHKVKSWASSLITRRLRTLDDLVLGENTLDSWKSASPELVSHSTSVPTPTLLENFDEDPTCTILSKDDNFAPVSPSLYPAPHDSAGVFSSQCSTPIIDLDDASAPFSTVTGGMHSPIWKNRSFSTARLSMHSSGSLGGFSGPGMHYHRRADSAPQLAMDFDRPALRRLHSDENPDSGYPMENVFEEDEEESEQTQTRPSTSCVVSSRSMLEQHTEVRAPRGHTAGSRSPRKMHRIHRSAAISNDVTSDSAASLTATLHEKLRSTSPLGIYPHTQQMQSVKVLGEHPGLVLSNDSSSNATPLLAEEPKGDYISVNAVSTPFPLVSNPVTPTDLTFLSPVGGYNPSHSISMPALDSGLYIFGDGRKGGGYGVGESGSDFRLSVDGVPSLISSRSGVTSATHTHIPSISSRHNAEYEGSLRSASSATQATYERCKRSSIASLSRLVGGSFGERSKLSLSQTVAVQNSTSTSKARRTRRLSRMLQFWKGKTATMATTPDEIRDA